MTGTLLASPATVGASFIPVAGSVVWQADCGHDVWLAPSSVEKIAAGGMEVMCIPCGRRSEAVQGSELGLLPGQMDEVEAEVGPEKRARLEQALKALGFDL